MVNWNTNSTFPGFLYAKINNDAEYIEAMRDLTTLSEFEGSFYGEMKKYTIRPIDEDILIEYFLKDYVTTLKEVNIQDFNIKPDENEYPVVLHFSSNHKYLTWYNLNSI